MNNKPLCLERLLRRPDVWRATDAANDRLHTLPTGHAPLDLALHQGGWPCAAVTELLGDQQGIGEIELLLPLLQYCSQDQRCLLWLGPPALPYAPALRSAGIATERLVVVRSRQLAELLWSAEQALRSAACSCLLAWLPAQQLDYHQLRRLQLAARDGNSPCFLFRPARAARHRSPAALRLSLHAAAQHLALTVLKQRGGPAGQTLHLPRDERLPGSRIAAIALPAVSSTPQTPDSLTQLHSAQRLTLAMAGAATPRQ